MHDNPWICYTYWMIDLAILPKIKNMTFKDARRQLLQMDEQLCTEIFISNLIAFLPNKDDDMRTMEKYMKESDEKRAELDYPEQFVVEVYANKDQDMTRLMIDAWYDCRWQPFTDTNHDFDSCFCVFSSGKDMSSCTRYKTLKLTSGMDAYIYSYCRICRLYWKSLNHCVTLKALENCLA